MESSDTLALPTISALRHLEPRSGGQWAVTGQSSSSYSLVYIMDDGSDAICYTMKPCASEEDVRTHCGSLMYNYSEDNGTDFEGLSATQNTASGVLQPTVRQKQDNGSTDSRSPGPDDLALDPFMVSPMPESQIFSFDEQQPQLGGFDQNESQNSMFELNNGPTNHQNQPQMMGAVNGSMNWPPSENILPVMATVSQLPVISGSVAPGNESNALVSDLWDENYTRIGPIGEDACSQPGWPLQFAAS